MAKYSKKAEKTVARAARKMKRGELRSSSGDKVTNPKQAIAIGISEAREKGYKVPPKKKKSRSKQ
jgi:hypothetical protein